MRLQLTWTKSLLAGQQTWLRISVNRLDGLFLQQREHSTGTAISRRALQEPNSSGAPAIKDVYFKEYLKSLTRPEDFWHEAAQALVWEKQYDTVLEDANSPYSKWFSGGKISVCYNALDRHCDDGNGDKVALIHASPVTDSTTSITYKELLHRVTHLAGYLRSIGVQKGDRVIVYMPMIPEAVVAMLACSRIGAIHSTVFGGFAAKELATRISHAKAVAVICGSCGIERGRPVDYKMIVDEAIGMAKHQPKHCIVFQRPGLEKPKFVKGRDQDWNDCMADGRPVDCLAVDANDPLYLIYTSGTTGAPKAVIRPAGGYAVALHWSMFNVWGMKPDDPWWAASDFGWVVGHSYIAYGPLLHRNPSVIYEGKPTGTPNAGSYFNVIEKHGVRGMFAAPTSVRAIRQEDPHMECKDKYDITSLQYLFVAGEHCDEETKHWARAAFGAPTLDNWWQTETGWPITSTCVGLGSPLDPPAHSSGHAVPGYDIRVVDSETGKALQPGELGRLIIKLPLPPGNFSGLWEDDTKFREAYFTKYPGYYDTMDAGTVDVDGYVSVLSRVDDIINVSGCRISTSALEEAILRHPEVADCAVVGVSDKMKGQVPLGFIVLSNGYTGKSADVIAEVIKLVRADIGPIASFRYACIVPKLPKTRSGKIARASLADLAESKPLKIPVTIEDPGVYPEIKTALQEIGYAKSTKSA
ncbi:Acyl-CoA synthetase short-chain family member 3, mitochondrial [Hypsibius exemplaris]|uniref:Acyl-CoA synthetase short-chain family member 3, mitochondrial n=1 Tax=Hypsibius exemplaris TaxID=2072580 RepID=A0A1W0XAL1_HYPEX|nr:Acyl-CoA synthetase short-chain family member 3, mitochondrial [Hypsibius exemplaris]